MILPSANNVNWAKQLLKVLLNAILAMLEHLAKPKVFVQTAQRVSTKTPKAKQNAVTFVPRLAKYPTTNTPDVNCHWYITAPDNTFGQGFSWENAPWFSAEGLRDIGELDGTMMAIQQQESSKS